ncbi:MAG: hypothetical protein OXE84_07310 [Rhodobacteraceae bacterium]|nr:hypothetical protein [Paracoccaceae bacterium]MCY4196784.1 hypothetical protein [Paracoccaceae bacterium]MCY4327061.1 hypothetical protein [Paracoccaceae bacterium]
MTPRGTELLPGGGDENGLAAAMDGLVARQDQIAPGLAKPHFAAGGRVSLI